VDVDFWESGAKSYVKLTAETEHADPAAPQPNWALKSTSCDWAQETAFVTGRRLCANRLIAECQRDRPGSCRAVDGGARLCRSDMCEGVSVRFSRITPLCQ
jgi:hypothetical protein